MRRFRWVIAGLLFLATTINYVDRQILALVKATLDHELGWTNEQYGYVNSAFQATYALSYVVFGWIIDRYGIKLGYIASIVIWSTAATCHGLVASVRGFLAARFALGAGEGGSFPACIKAVAYWFPPHERALAASLFNSGANVGPIVAPLVVPWIAATFGWRAAFVLAGICGFLWLGLWLPLFSLPDESRFLSAAERAYIDEGRAGDAATRRPATAARVRPLTSAGATGHAPPIEAIDWWRLFTYRDTWAYIVAKFLTDPISWFWLIWLPDFFYKTRGFDIRDSWLDLVTIYAISLTLSVTGGWLSGFLLARGWSVTRARKTSLLIFAACVTPVVLAIHASVWIAVLLIGLALAAHHAWATTFYAVVSDVFPKPSVAAIAGIGGMAGSVGGILFPTFCGWMLDRYQHRPGGETAGYAVLFAICSTAYLVAFAINHLLAPRFAPIRDV